MRAAGLSSLPGPEGVEPYASCDGQPAGNRASGVLLAVADLSESKNGLRAAEVKADAKALVRAKLTTPDPRAAKIAFWDWDLSSNVLTWSDEMKNLFGVDREAMDKKFDPWAAWRSALHPEDLSAAEQCMTLAARDGTPIAINYRIVLPDGSVRQIEADGDIIRDRKGQADRIAGSCRDATKWRITEEKLESQRRQLEASLAERTSELDVALRRLEHAAYELTENIPVGTYTFVKRPGERLGRYEFMSNRFIELQGLDREAVAADIRNGLAVVHPDDAEEWARLNLEAIDAEQPFRGEARHLVKGEYRWIAAEDITRKLPDGTVIWEGVVTDITDRKVAEQKLAESEARYRLLADNSADVIWLMDLETLRFTYVSPSVERLRGFTAEEVLQQGAREAMTAESYQLFEELLPKRLAAFAVGEESMRTMTQEFIQSRKDKTLVTTEVTTTLLGETGVPPKRMLGISRDITERKTIEAALNAARKREKQTEKKMRATLEKKLKTSLNAAAVAHEINQPLSRILLRARMNLERSKGGDDQMLRALIDDAERVVSTIAKMKALLRNVESVQEDVDLNQILASALHQLKSAIRATKAKVVQIGPEQVCLVRGDAAQLKMVFVNLVQNALDAVGNSRRKRKQISIESVVRDGCIDIVVGDSGPGWPGGTLDEMLLSTSKPGGSGIGLYVVKTAVENHRGRIVIGNSSIGGAEFRISFPRGGETTRS